MKFLIAAAASCSGGGRGALAELHISFIWELNVLQHPSNLGFVSTIPQRQRGREGGVG